MFHVDSQGNSQEFVFSNYIDVTNNANGMQMILGNNNVAFLLGDTRRVVAFNANSGAPLWSWQAPQDHRVGLVAASDGGGLVASDSAGYPFPQTIVRFDSSGNAAYDTWTSAAATNAGAASLANISYIAADVFAANPVDSQGTVSSQTLMMASGSNIDWALYSPWPSPQPDRSSDPKAKLTLTVSNVYVTTPQDIQADSTVLTKVNNARDFWWKKAKIQIDWGGTVLPIKSCDPAYPNGCGANPQLDIASITNSVNAGEVLRRFCGSQNPTNNCTPKGVQLVFTANIVQLSVVGGTTYGWTGFRGSSSSPFLLQHLRDISYSR